MKVEDELSFVEWLRNQPVRSHQLSAISRQPGETEGRRHERAKGRRGGGSGAGESRRRPSVKLGVGDDMAVLDLGAGVILVSSDMLLDGVHFDTDKHALALIGRKAIACGLSDCAAMAVQPVAATVSIAWPRDRAMSDAQELFSGMAEMAAEFGVAIVGGDTTCWAHPLALDVNVTAIPHTGITPVTRSGARPGDALYVTGPLGGSLLGRHLEFVPRVLEAQWLGERLGDRLHAMIDISDGLSLDLWRICEASGVGATLEAARLEAVISESARLAAAADGASPMDHALHDGEDFELLLAVDGDVVGQVNDLPLPHQSEGAEARSDGGIPTSPGQAPARRDEEAKAGESPALPLVKIGQVTSGGLCLRRADGTIETLDPQGYVHGR